MKRWAILTVSLLHAALARADDGRGLARGADPDAVSLSGLSSGAAMAVQYAVAHSGTVTAVGAVAGPQWACAPGSLSRAVNACLCGRDALAPTLETARRLSEAGAIDRLAGSRPARLSRSYVFQSAADETVAQASGEANAAFLRAFTGAEPTVDRGEAADGSDRAGHGILVPGAGTESCALDGREQTYIRGCGSHDNAGRMFEALFGQGPDASRRRVDAIPDSEVWRFDQRALVERVKAEGAPVAADYLYFYVWPARSTRRSRFDLADQGSLYVPHACRAAGSRCRVHVALHGCKQDARTFALKAGYNNWAEAYRVIVVYPALAPDAPTTDALCRMPHFPGAADAAWIEPNPNGCWDWWGYLDPPAATGRHLTKAAPQMRVIEAIVTALTAPAP